MQQTLNKKKAPEEFNVAAATSVVLGLAVAALPSVHEDMENDRQGRRTAMLLATAVTALGVVVPPVMRPFAGYLTDKQGFESRCVRACVRVCQDCVRVCRDGGD